MRSSTCPPPMKTTLPWLLIAMLTLASCAKLGSGGAKPDSEKPEPNPFGPTGIPPSLRGNQDDAGTPVKPGGNTATLPLNTTPENEIIFTDPDHPDKDIPELTALFANKPTFDKPWEESVTRAKQRAAREGKPLLIWFTDSKNSPMCKALSQELFSTPDWEQWASEKLVRLRVDSNPVASDYVKDRDISLGDKENRIAEVRGYSGGLKKQYKVLGHPTLVLCNPSGEVISKYTGYKRGQRDFTWGLIKQGEAASAAAYQKWRAGLEKKGYREWSDRHNRTILAKLVSYSNGTLVFIEPDGTRGRTEETKLCDKDRAWITEQKRLRGIN